MAKDLTGSVAVATPTKNVVSLVEIHPLRDRPLVLWRCRGMVPRENEDGTPATNALGEPAYDEPGAGWEYARTVDDPAFVAELLTQATLGVLQGAGAVDVYAALEATAQSVEDRLSAGEVLPVRTAIMRGGDLMPSYGLAVEAAQPPAPPPPPADPPTDADPLSPT